MRKILKTLIGHLVGLPFLVLFSYVIGPIVGLTLGFGGLLMLTLLGGRAGRQAFYRGMILGEGPDASPAMEERPQGHEMQ
jgi:hypothetical protein